MNPKSVRTLIVFALLLLAFDFACAQARSDLLATAGSRNYIRMAKDGGVPVALEVSIVRFAPRGSSSESNYVDLVSAVHVADRKYYQTLNERFKQYDVVLYELVAPEGTIVPKGGGESSGWASMLQGGLKDLLGLTHQLEEVDYNQANFVHADLTPEQFSTSMDQKGESFFLILFNAWITAMAAPQATGSISDYDLIAAFFSRDRPRALKTLMARQFNDMDYFMKMLEGGENGSTLITERNRKALDVLRQQLADGEKRVAIFYGGGHMSDMAERLQTDFSMVPVSQIWIEAWNLRAN